MLELYFASDKEAISFCEQLFQYNKEIELHWKTDEEWGNHLLIVDGSRSPRDNLINAMMDVFLLHRLKPMMQNVITVKYYFRTHEEIERILELTNWLFSGEDADSSHMSSGNDPHEMLEALMHANINVQKAIHFDSIIQFRLQPFKELLTQYVGLAIDEYKREEEHQTFIDTIREYVTNRAKGCAIIHILQDRSAVSGDSSVPVDPEEPFVFFMDNGKVLNRMELYKIVQNEPLYMVGLDGEEWNLAPLVAMNPQNIIVYGNDPSEAKTLTVMNIFEERVQLKSAGHFPFSIDGIHRPL